MQAGMDFGWLLDWFWMDFGRVLGAKLEPKSNKNQRKNNKKSIWKGDWIFDRKMKGAMPAAPTQVAWDEVP